MTDPIRIANCSGFYGDRLSAAREMVEGGPIDVLTGDWLAELTMLILARTQAKRPGGGYARTFVTQMEQVMGICLDRHIKVVSNAGGLDPRSCAEAVAEVADRLGLAPTVAYVEGDDLLGRLDELAEAGLMLGDFDTGKPMLDTSRFISANAYLGGWGIVDALERGADIVVTGRTTDAAVVAAPAAWHHGWARDDWDALAGGVVAGHIIECGTQATGGNYSFFGELGGLEHTGFPWAEIAADGSSIIGKHNDGTGGAVTVGTVTAQLLYEIGAPAYLGPDVTARFDTIRLEQVDRDRVGVSAVRGQPPPDSLKVSMNELGGFRTDISIALTGLDIEAKAALVEKAFWASCPTNPDDYESVTTTVVRTDSADPATNEEAVAAWKITLKDPDERKLRVARSAVNELALATIPGLFGLGGGSAKPFGVHRAALVPAGVVPQHVVVLGGEQSVVDSVAPAAVGEVTIARPDPPGKPPTGDTERAPLGRIVGARSGDKGGDANLGVFCRSAEAFAWLDSFLTTERLRQLLPETADLAVDRHRLPNIWSLNFVIHGLLQEGVAASTRQDGQAKGLGEWLRARYVEIPRVLL
ncbi:MAG TPA: acyclic terpene utilization AtuA family protein [Acidimicrobiales bacterium]